MYWNQSENSYQDLRSIILVLKEEEAVAKIHKIKILCSDCCYLGFGLTSQATSQACCPAHMHHHTTVSPSVPLGQPQWQLEHPPFPRRQAAGAKNRMFGMCGPVLKQVFPSSHFEGRWNPLFSCAKFRKVVWCQAVSLRSVQFSVRKQTSPCMANGCQKWDRHNRLQVGSGGIHNGTEIWGWVCACSNLAKCWWGQVLCCQCLFGELSKDITSMRVASTSVV